MHRISHTLVDVKATGGWRDTNTLLTCYQQTDEESMLQVMEAPIKLRSVAQARAEKLRRNCGRRANGRNPATAKSLPGFIAPSWARAEGHLLG